MKFKQRQRQNQRIEKITSNHLIIGIDIAKFTHVARAVDYRGIERSSHFTFSNDLQGFEALVTWIQKVMSFNQKTHIIVGVEPTGHYWLNLAYWLQEHNIELVLVNPFHVKRSKENRDNSPTKNDVKDALVIADMVKNGCYSEVQLQSERYQALRQLVTTREFIVKQAVSVQNQIHRWVDMYFPEFRQVFKDVTCKTALASLDLFPLPSDVRSLSPEGVVSQWKSKLKRTGNRSTAISLILWAKQSSGLQIATQQARTSIRLLIHQLDLLNKQLTELEGLLEKQIEKIPMTASLQAIKGFSHISIATLYSEAGALSQFHHGRQLLCLAGLHLSENSSGVHKGKVTLTKRGRPGLRKILYLIVLHLVSVNPEFRALHQHNKQVKKMKGMQSLMKLCGKLARILVAMAKNNSTYNAGMLRYTA